MATTFIRIKVELPDPAAERFVLDQRGPGDPLEVRAKDIVAEVTHEVLTELADSPLVTEYHATISRAPR